MSIKHLAIVGIAAAALTACGGKGGEAGKTDAAAPVAASQPAGNDFMSVYVRDLNKIADAVEKTYDEASAHEAALVIQTAGAELDTMSKEFEAKPAAEKTALIMARSDFVQANQRMAMAMMKLSTADPKTMQMISEAMDKLPKVDH